MALLNGTLRNILYLYIAPISLFSRPPTQPTHISHPGKHPHPAIQRQLRAPYAEPYHANNIKPQNQLPALSAHFVLPAVFSPHALFVLFPPETLQIPQAYD